MFYLNKMKIILEYYFEAVKKFSRIVGKVRKDYEKIIDFSECFDSYDFELW